MNAAFTTEGKTTTQSALSSKSCGMLSGTSRISFKTVPQFRKRSSSLLSSEAFATELKIGETANRKLHRHGNNFGMMDFLPEVFLASQEILQPGCHPRV